MIFAPFFKGSEMFSNIGDYADRKSKCSHRFFCDEHNKEIFKHIVITSLKYRMKNQCVYILITGCLN